MNSFIRLCTVSSRCESPSHSSLPIKNLSSRLLLFLPAVYPKKRGRLRHEQTPELDLRTTAGGRVYRSRTLEEEGDIYNLYE